MICKKIRFNLYLVTIMLEFKLYECQMRELTYLRNFSICQLLYLTLNLQLFFQIFSLNSTEINVKRALSFISKCITITQ